MDSSLPYNDDEKVENHLSKSQVLEMAYQESLRKSDLIIKDEGARRLRLRILLLENENDDLHEQLALADDRIEGLEKETEELRRQFDQAQEDAGRYESDLRAQTRESNNLRAELASMNGVTTESAKILTEKLSLTRQLATLKPELEHLRSQAAYQQTVLSEKLALQRQVSTLEVELETEKRASKRAAEKSKSKDRELQLQQQLDDLQKDLLREKRERDKDRKETEKDLEVEKRALKRAMENSNNRDREFELQVQLEDLRKELAGEKRERERALKEVEIRAAKTAAKKTQNDKERELELEDQFEDLQKDIAREKREAEKARKEAEKELGVSETQKTVLESKLDLMRTKLRSTREELKECQRQLTHARAAVKVGPTSTRGDAPAKNPRKRGAIEMKTDDTIGTPDGVAARGKRPAMKRARMDQTVLGEKSMFSITPFLNRTINAALDTPTAEEDDGAEKQAAQQEREGWEDAFVAPLDTTSPSASPKAKSKRKPTEKKVSVEKILGEAKAGTNNKKPAPKKSRTVSILEKVTEEEADENEEPTIALPAIKVDGKEPEAVKPSQVLLKNTEDAGPKKKKRKLLGAGKTLFDEEDAEATKRPAKINLGLPRLLGKGAVAAPKGGVKAGLGAASGFGAFSPLKKDRRGVGASFLA